MRKECHNHDSGVFVHVKCWESEKAEGGGKRKGRYETAGVICGSGEHLGGEKKAGRILGKSCGLTRR